MGAEGFAERTEITTSASRLLVSDYPSDENVWSAAGIFSALFMLARPSVGSRYRWRVPPGGPCELVGHGHYDDVLMGPGIQSIEPGPDGKSIPLHPSHSRSCAVNQEFAQVYVAALADT